MRSTPDVAVESFAFAPTSVRKPHPIGWRGVTGPKPNTVRVADITCVPTRQGWLYRAAMLDMNSRRIVGWALGDRADPALASAAFEVALTERKSTEGMIHRSDGTAALRQRRRTSLDW